MDSYGELKECISYENSHFCITIVGYISHILFSYIVMYCFVYKETETEKSIVSNLKTSHHCNKFNRTSFLRFY